ncbi:MAG: hypothetical protein AAF726_18595 [Planctomycetota bacterium]
MSPVPVLVGVAVGLVLFALGLALRGEDGRRPLAHLLAAVAPVAAVLAAHQALGKSFPAPPTEFLDWVLLAGAAVIPVGVIAGRGGALSVISVVLLAAVAGALFFFPTETLHERYWNGEVALYVGVLAGAATLAFTGRLIADAQDRTVEAALATGLAAVAAALALGLSGTSVGAQLVASLASTAGLFGVALLAAASLRENAAPVSRAMAAPQSLLFAGLLATGVLYASTPRHAGAMLLLAPLATILPGRGLVASIVRLVLVAAVSGAAAWLSRSEPNPYGY